LGYRDLQYEELERIRQQLVELLEQERAQPGHVETEKEIRTAERTIEIIEARPVSIVA
jgi:hypothetical protein